MADYCFIGEAARRSGVSIKAIRFYESQGLIPTAHRRGRYRIYNSNDIARISLIKEAKEYGFALDELRGLLKFAFEEGHCQRVYALIDEKREALLQQSKCIREQADQLFRLKMRLQGKDNS